MGNKSSQPANNYLLGGQPQHTSYFPSFMYHKEPEPEKVIDGEITPEDPVGSLNTINDMIGQAKNKGILASFLNHGKAVGSIMKMISGGGKKTKGFGKRKYKKHTKKHSGKRRTNKRSSRKIKRRSVKKQKKH